MSNQSEDDDISLLEIDSLPYIDIDIDNDITLKSEINELILNEMKLFKPKKYLSDLPELFENNKFLQSELKRIEDNIKNNKNNTQINMDSYILSVPSDEKKDSIEEWNKSIYQAKSLIEYQTLQYVFI